MRLLGGSPISLNFGAEIFAPKFVRENSGETKTLRKEF